MQPAPARDVLRLPDADLRLIGDPAPFAIALSARELEPGLHEIALELTAAAPAVPPRLTLALSRPLVDVSAMWTTAAGRNKAIGVNWGPLRVRASATCEAPVACLVSGAGESRWCLALDDALTPSELTLGVIEEDGRLDARAHLFVAPRPAATRLRATLRLDARPQRYERALGGVSAWWASRYAPAPVPEVGRQAMYSTWYAFHQRVDADAVVAECARAKALGCEAVIVDDGWQTLDANRGYAFCGDWLPERVPAMRAFVDRVHALGMRFLLWYSVPYVGERSAAWARFAGKLLRHDREQRCGTLDPRYPEVRDYLIGVYERAMREWDLDGFKLDFVDCFQPADAMPAGAVDGRDIAGVAEAADRLLADVLARVRAIKPDALIEFRQSYVGPLMRRYGNLFRAGDCPADHVRNRLATVDLRLLMGESAVHADMLTWHPDEPAESAALQLLAVLFAVPQISVRLDRLPAAHAQMLAHWLRFWRERRACLLDGELTASSPELNYPLVAATTADEHVAAAYADVVVPLPARRSLHVVNATRGARLVLETPDLGERRVVVVDCRGAVVRDERVRLAYGAHAIAVPPAGRISLSA